MASTTTPKKETAAQRAKRLNEGGGKASAPKAAAKKNTAAKAASNGKVRQIDIVAKVITDLGGKAKLADVAKVVEDKKLIPNLGPYTYRKLYGIILRDMKSASPTVAKAGKGEFKVLAKKS